MALTPSNPFPVGTSAPEFNLEDTVSGKRISLQEVKGENGTVVMFICNHCPYVIHVNHELVRLANQYSEKGIGFVAISSNDVDRYPQDAPELMELNAKENNYPFPYLYDETQDVAKSYDAACTPDFYLFDSNLKSMYHGQLDNSRPGNSIPVDGASLREAIERLLKDKNPITNQKVSIGCGIKWK